MFCILDRAFSNYDERNTNEMHFQIMMKERPTKCIFKANRIFRIRRISSGFFGLPEDGTPAAPKHVGVGLIF
jgi:hypothetical protein